MKSIAPLTPEQLSANIHKRIINHALKDDAVLHSTFIGQERAREALEFGLGIDAKGYNLYVMGEHATGRYTLVQEYVEKVVSKTDTPDDWCYINNFDDNHAPFKLYVSPGDGKLLIARINTFIDDLINLFPEIFDNPSYQRQKAAIDREFNQKYDDAIGIVEQTALQNGAMLYEENGEVGFSLLIDGKPLNDKEFANVDEQKRNEFYALLGKLEDLLSEQLLELPLWKRTSSVKLRKLRNDTAEQSIRPFIKELEHEFASNLGVLKYLDRVKEHIVDAVLEILANETEENQNDKDARKMMVERFLPNLLVERDVDAGAPIIYEQNPTYQNLFGHVDFASFQGSVYTSYRLIRPGALHKANGGYLILDVEKLLNQPMVWSRLKLALKTQKVSGK